METNELTEEAIEVLQELGLKEYEARCFVGLSRMSSGTAKTLSETTDVPRTRVYDAIRVLEAKGLVEVQHATPQRFRAVPLTEATETLRDQYESRIDRFASAIDEMGDVETREDESIQEVWAMAGSTAVENRTNQLIAEGTEEVVLVVGDDALLTDELAATLTEVGDGTDLVVGALTPELEDHVRDVVPEAETFVSGLEWLHSDGTDDGVRGDADRGPETAVGRLLLVDRSNILVSSIVPGTGEEHAIFGTGFGNGLVVIARRLMAQGLLAAHDPGQEQGQGQEQEE